MSNIEAPYADVQRFVEKCSLESAILASRAIMLRHIAVQTRNGRWLRCDGRFPISKADDCPSALNILHDPFQAVWYVKIAIK